MRPNSQSAGHFTANTRLLFYLSRQPLSLLGWAALLAVGECFLFGGRENDGNFVYLTNPLDGFAVPCYFHCTNRRKC